MAEGDLTPFLPTESATVKAIYAAYKKAGDAEPQRGYLGASIVGHDCDRYLWYVFRGLVREDTEGRIYRLFATGDLEEARLVADLRAIGCEVTGEQHEITDLGGHFSGHMDGAALNVPEAPKTWHVCEFKTHNAKSFAKLVKEGARASKPMHFAQVQVYMGATGMKRALYLARNKDTDELYSERIDFDAAAYKALMERAARVIRAAQPLERCASRQDDRRCKWCPAYALCWGTELDGSAPVAAVPIKGGVTCKSCCHASPITDGEGARWNCGRYTTTLKAEETAMGAKCPSHLLLPGLVSFAEPTDADADGIEFTSRDGTKWQHGTRAGQWTTHELISGRGPLDGALAQPTAGQVAAVSEAAERFLAAADDGLLARYPWTESERLWDGPQDGLEQALKDWKLWALLSMEPLAVQDDENTNAADYLLDNESYLVVTYKQDGASAIWRGKS